MEKQAQPPGEGTTPTPAIEQPSAVIVAQAIEHIVSGSLGPILSAAATAPPAALSAPRPNKGRFRKGDPRINREGRPRGSKRPPPAKTLEVRAARTDRLMWFGYLAKNLRELLQPSGGTRRTVSNLPADWGIVDFRVYGNGFIAVIIRSKSFPRVARNALIPQFAKVEYRGGQN